MQRHMTEPKSIEHGRDAHTPLGDEEESLGARQQHVVELRQTALLCELDALGLCFEISE